MTHESKEEATPFINAYFEEIMANYNKSKSTHFKYRESTLEPFTDAKEFFNYLGASNYYYLTLECSGWNDKMSSQMVLSDRHNKSMLCNMQVRFLIKERPEALDKDPRYSAYHKENNLYCGLLPSLLDYCDQAWCPLTYLCRNNLLVLQDLSNMGYVNLLEKESVNKLAMFRVLESLAKMHASSLAFEHYGSTLINEIYGYCLEEVLVATDLPWFQIGVKTLIDLAKSHPDYTKAYEQKFIENDLINHLNSVCTMVRPSTTYRNVLCHGCPWTGNIFLNNHDARAPAIFVDYQTCRYCPPAIDIIFALYMNLIKEDRLKYEEELLKHYYECLLKSLDYNSLCAESVGISEEQILKSYKEFQLFGLVFQALAATMLRVPQNYINDHYKYVDRSTDVMAYMVEDENFSSIILDHVKDILDYIMTTTSTPTTMDS